jgi:hypothetical protein
MRKRLKNAYQKQLKHSIVPQKKIKKKQRKRKEKIEG